MAKFNKALNNVFFGDLCLVENVAKFDRFVKEEESKEGPVETSKKGSDEGEKNGRILDGKKKRERKGGEGVSGGIRKLELEKVKEEAIRREKERERELVVKVGEIECSGRKEKLVLKGVEGEVKGAVMVDKEVGMEPVGDTEAEAKVTCKFMQLQEDIAWASKSTLAKLKNDYCLSFVQQSFLDVGFDDFRLISLGGDNVLLHPGVVGDVVELFSTAADLIGNFWEDCRPWTKETIVNYERGAWVRCYGVPIQAWNNIFFLELAATQGLLLKIDDFTINKDRMDYARLLVATPLLKEINVIEEVWIDGKKFPIRIIEDIKFGFAKDACLVECEDDNNSQCSIPEGFKEDEPIVDALVQQIHDDWVSKTNEHKEMQSDIVNQQPTKLQSDTVQVVQKKTSSRPKCKSLAESSEGTAMVKQSNESTSSQQVLKRRKVTPSLTGLEKIARLSATDRNELIRSLKRSKKKQAKMIKSKSLSGKKKCASLSPGSGNSAESKEWKTWVTLHGDAKGVEADIKNVGEVIGVRCNNSFQVLARGGGK